jgi:hypothetical protein
MSTSLDWGFVRCALCGGVFRGLNWVEEFGRGAGAKKSSGLFDLSRLLTTGAVTVGDWTQKNFLVGVGSLLPQRLRQHDLDKAESANNFRLLRICRYSQTG